MTNDIQSTLRFIDYQVNDIEFHINNVFEEHPLNVNFNIDRFVEYKEDEDNTMFVTLVVSIFENAKENNYPFSLDVNLTGVFELENIDAENRVSFAEVNAVAILFPYVRALVSSFTANANIQPLILPAINVVKMIEDNPNRMKH